MRATRGKTILLTGRTGFIGRNLQEYLSSKYKILAPSHKELELLDQEEVKTYFQKNNIDIVVHSAVHPAHRKIREPKDIAYKNLRIFFNIARNSPRFSKMIFLGSGAEYGIQEDIVNVKETSFDIRVPEDEHGFSKYVCSQYIEKADNLINLRIFGIFGKYEDYQIRFISNAICKAIFGVPITVNQNRIFSYLYVDDLGPIVEYFIEHKATHKTYNVTPPEKYELVQLAEQIKQISGKNLEIRVKNAGMGKEYTGSNSRLVREVKNPRFKPMREALMELYGWYEEHKQEIDRTLLLVDL